VAACRRLRARAIPAATRTAPRMPRPQPQRSRASSPSAASCSPWPRAGSSPTSPDHQLSAGDRHGARPSLLSGPLGAVDGCQRMRLQREGRARKACESRTYQEAPLFICLWILGARCARGPLQDRRTSAGTWGQNTKWSSCGRQCQGRSAAKWMRTARLVPFSDEASTRTTCRLPHGPHP